MFPQGSDRGAISYLEGEKSSKEQVHNDRRNWKNACVICVVRRGDVKELKFRAATSGISSRGVEVY